MSDTQEEVEVEEAPKKKSKLPIILILVLLLGGGGFFVMKVKGGKKPEIKLGSDKAVELKEFLVNLRDPGVYCRTEIGLVTAEGTDPKLIEDHMSAVRDAINLRLSSKTLHQLQGTAQLKVLKREIAKDVNAALAVDGNAPGAAKSDDPKPADSKPTPPLHPDWDSDTGPVLKVYFDSFATQ